MHNTHLQCVQTDLISSTKRSRKGICWNLDLIIFPYDWYPLIHHVRSICKTNLSPRPVHPSALKPKTRTPRLRLRLKFEPVQMDWAHDISNVWLVGFNLPTLYCQSKRPPCIELARTGISDASDSSGPASRSSTRQPKFKFKIKSMLKQV